MISKRLSDISSYKEHFDKAASIYNEVLKNGGFNETLKFLPTILVRRHRGRNILRFIPTFSSNVKKNVGKICLTLLQKHFWRHHKYSKLFNKNNVKFSYSCIPNMNSVIQNHNANSLSNHITLVAARSCSCLQKTECLLHN